MATYPAIFSSNLAAHSWFTHIGLYTKFPSYPDVQTVLADLIGGSTVEMRLVLTNGGVFFVEGRYHGYYCRANLTPHLQLLTGHWYWIEFAFGATSGTLTGATDTANSIGLVGKAEGAGGNTDGPQGVFAPAPSASDIVNSQVAWGVSLNAAYGNQHNEPGRLIAQPRIGIGNAAVDGAVAGSSPTADLLCSAIDGLYYPTHEAVGPSAKLAESCVSGHGYDMDSGPNGLTIVRDSPY